MQQPIPVIYHYLITTYKNYIWSLNSNHTKLHALCQMLNNFFLPGKAWTICTLHFSSLLVYTAPKLVWRLCNVHGWSALSFEEAKPAVWRSFMVEHLLQPLGVEIGESFAFLVVGQQAWPEVPFILVHQVFSQIAIHGGGPQTYSRSLPYPSPTQVTKGVREIGIFHIKERPIPFSFLLFLFLSWKLKGNVKIMGAITNGY